MTTNFTKPTESGRDTQQESRPPSLRERATEEANIAEGLAATKQAAENQKWIKVVERRLAADLGVDDGYESDPSESAMVSVEGLHFETGYDLGTDRTVLVLVDKCPVCGERVTCTVRSLASLGKKLSGDWRQEHRHHPSERSTAERLYDLILEIVRENEH